MVMRQVIEVPVEVPVPVHVPVPVAYPVPTASASSHPMMMSRMDAHPMMMAPTQHPIMSVIHGHHGHPMMMSPSISYGHGHPSRMMMDTRMSPAASEGDGEEGHQDQIVLFYDAELHDKDNDNENNAGNGNNDDLQQSASEHRSPADRNAAENSGHHHHHQQQHQQGRPLFPMRGGQAQAQHPLFMIPSRSAERALGMERSLDRVTGQERMSGQSPTPANLNRLRLLREIAKRSELMAAAASSNSNANSGLRVFPLNFNRDGNNDDEMDVEVVQGRPAQEGPPGPGSAQGSSPAFIVLAQDGNNNNNNNQNNGEQQNPVERR